MEHDQMYIFISTIQILDIILNFLKIQIVDVKEIKKPIEVAERYIRGNFLSDVIAVLPYSVINPNFIWLRYLKLLKFKIYQKYFDEFIIESTQNWLNFDQ